MDLPGSVSRKFLNVMAAGYVTNSAAIWIKSGSKVHLSGITKGKEFMSM